LEGNALKDGVYSNAGAGGYAGRDEITSDGTCIYSGPHGPSRPLRRGRIIRDFAPIAAMTTNPVLLYAQDLAPGRIDLLFDTPLQLPLVRAGTIQALAVTSDTRILAAPSRFPSAAHF
jgi:hypothetical protein